MLQNKEYIGDAVYVQHDELNGVWLTAEDGISAYEKIYLEPVVMRRLVEYLRHFKLGPDKDDL